MVWRRRVIGPDDDESHVASFARPCAHHLEDEVLGRGTRKDDRVATCPQMVSLHMSYVGVVNPVATVRDHRDAIGACSGLEMSSYVRVVGDQVRADPAAHPVIEPQ